MNDSRSNSGNQNKTPIGSNEGEVSLLDILPFLRRSYKKIAIIGLIGLLGAVAYLIITPKQYEAVAQIAVGQISIVNNNKVPNLLSANVEELPLVIARFSQPTSFTSQVYVACGVDGGVNPGETLIKSIKMTPHRGGANLIELKVFAASPQDARSCAQAIFELIKITQAQIVTPYIEITKTRLANYEERLLQTKDLLIKLEKPGAVIGPAYLATRDETRFLLGEIAILNDVISSYQLRATHLVSPIYASDTPIAPKKRTVLAGGLLGGLFIGLLLALACQKIARIKNDMVQRS